MNARGYREPNYGCSHALTKYRKRHNLSQRQLAEIIGVDHANIQRWESGEYQIRATRVKEVSRLLGISKRALRPDIFG